ncbi:MAG: hypothetical protein R3C59_12470 [Planctomycetaceae bacterium]
MNANDGTTCNRIESQKSICEETMQMVVVACLSVLLSGSSALAQKASVETYTAEELQQHFLNVAGNYKMVVDQTQLKLRPQPLMYWQNPVRKQEQGALFAWLKNGRPAAMGSIFTYGADEGTVCRHEMISLADAPLESRLNGVVVWAPDTPGLKWQPVIPSISPAITPTRRLTQMRSIARSFDGLLYEPGGQISKLTLIPQPVLRYESPEAGVVDGAVFSLAVATDPEIFLVLEAQKDNTGKVDWHFATARSHFYALELNRNGERVWQVESVPELLLTDAAQKPWMNAPYFIFFESQPLPAPETLR